MKKIIILISVMLSKIYITGCTNNDTIFNTDEEILQYLNESDFMDDIGKENICPAWNERKQAQAKMRMKIKKLLKKYDYPPNKSEKAVEDVMEQVTLQCVAGL